MKSKIYYLAISFLLALIARAPAQNDFDVQAYLKFLQDNENLESAALLSRHQPKTACYNGITPKLAVDQFAYLDSIILKYELTANELALLRKNHFVVSERLSFYNIIEAMDDVFIKELPVFITSDAILHALHISYANLLIHIESSFLQPRIQDLVTALNQTFPQIQQKYAARTEMADALKDVDLYLTIARSLLNNQVAAPQFTSPAEVNTIWQAIQAEKFVSIPLFTAFSRRIDFSQFTVRGHYTRSQSFKNYFKTMMWLAQIEFVLANPPQEWYNCGLTKTGLIRLNIDALLLNELLDLANVRNLLDEIDYILRFMVGESDNLTPSEFSDFVLARNIMDATALLDEPTFDAFVDSLVATQAFGQKILSNFMKGTPGTTKPTTLPVSFRLMGQRFIIDSCIFYKVVYDNVIYQNQKICRMLPDPLDAMFALGNDDALHLLKSELETWNYAAQLAALRYLVDSYSNDFWNNSLYNVWLHAIRQLNPGKALAGVPLFMQTTAWHQQKLNTQLCAWTQLRHDNLLYAKQSYTHGGDCFYPHSFVEPYPELYQQIARFAQTAVACFAGFPAAMSGDIVKYFQNMQNIMQTLEKIARKELNREPLSDDEICFLQQMLFVTRSSADTADGWYVDLLFQTDGMSPDFLVADVHTQPTDCAGNEVGRVLHVGVGMINLGVFLADSPSNDFHPMAYVGPVMSGYQTITENFKRLTDEDWTMRIVTGDAPPRPDWVNIYLADPDGNRFVAGRELPGVQYTNAAPVPAIRTGKIILSQNYPNPFNPSTTIEFSLPQPEHVHLEIFNSLGQKIDTIVAEKLSAGNYQYVWPARDMANGIYFYRLSAGDFVATRKLILMR